MGNMASGNVTSTATPAISAIPTSFVYEDLVSHTQAIQRQMIEIIKFLDDRWKNEKKTRDQLKSRSLVFIDPYGNQIVNKYMDHELISTVFRKYKKDYVPRYLHQWIKIGTMNQSNIEPLEKCELQSTVSKYTAGYQFVTYGEVNVWIGSYEYLPPHKFVLKVRLNDTIEKIEMHLKKRHKCTKIELKSCIINQNEKPNTKDWDEGTILKSEDTIMSCQLYQDNCIIMAKLIKDMVNCSFFFFEFFMILYFSYRLMLQIPILVFKYLLKLLLEQLTL
jgi:hypothetical protein